MGDPPSDMLGGPGAPCALGRLDARDFPAGAERVTARQFADRADLCTVKLPEGITAIEERAFARCVGIRELVLPSTVTRIGQSAFDDCSVGVYYPSTTTLALLRRRLAARTVGAAPLWLPQPPPPRLAPPGRASVRAHEMADPRGQKTPGHSSLA